MSSRFEEKVALVERWARVFARAEAVIVFHRYAIHGNKELELRRALGAGGEGRYLVLKNRLVRRIVAGTRHASIAPLLRGESSFFLIHGDPQAALRRLFAYLDRDFPRRLDDDLAIDWHWLNVGRVHGQKPYRISRYTPPELVVKAGSLGGSLLSAEDLRELAALPSRDELRSQLLATLAAPAATLLATMAAPAAKLLATMAARR